MPKKSNAEVLAYFNCQGLPPSSPEWRFHPERKWRFDFAWPEQKVAVEIEGGFFAGGRHSRGFGAKKDMEKYNSAILHGWYVLRYMPEQVCRETTTDDIKRVLKRRGFGVKPM